MKETTVPSGGSNDETDLECDELKDGNEMAERVDAEWGEADWFIDWLELAKSRPKKPHIS